MSFYLLTCKQINTSAYVPLLNNAILLITSAYPDIYKQNFYSKRRNTSTIPNGVKTTKNVFFSVLISTIFTTVN